MANFGQHSKIRHFVSAKKHIQLIIEQEITLVIFKLCPKFIIPQPVYKRNENVPLPKQCACPCCCGALLGDWDRVAALTRDIF